MKWQPPYIPFAWIDDMKIPIAIITLLILLFFVLLCSGCGVLIVRDTKNGEIAAVQFSVLQDITVARYATTDRGTTIERGSSVVNDAAVEKIVEGVVAGVVRGVKP